MSTGKNVADASMFELYRLEAEDQTRVLTSELLALERAPTAPEHLEVCMRAAHSLKGAARIIGFDLGVKVAHLMEDVLVSAQSGVRTLQQSTIDELLRGSDLLRRMAHTSESALNDPKCDLYNQAQAFEQALQASLSRAPTVAREDERQPAPDAGAPEFAAGVPSQAKVPAPTAASNAAVAPAPATGPATGSTSRAAPATAGGPAPSEARMLRVTAEHLDRLLRLAGESLVESRRIKHGVDLAHRLYEAALACRMRPFVDGTHGLERMVRDLARKLGKKAHLEIVGEDTPVDRDVLERLEAPLGHLLRNAIDHGIEMPDARLALGKPAEGTVRVHARHSAGQLLVEVSDDGRGIPLEKLRAAVVERGLAVSETAARLTPTELLEFLFLPGFTLKEEVTDISGRGIGLDVVQDTVRKVRGTVRVTSEESHGTRFHLQLPLTLSVVRALIVEVAGEPYAIPLAQILRAQAIQKAEIEFLEGRPHFRYGKRPTGLVAARQVILGQSAELDANELFAVVLGTRDRIHALVVDRLLGEYELVVQALDRRLSKVQDVAAAAVMEDGAPVLILDVEDLVHSIEKLSMAGSVASAAPAAQAPSTVQAAPRVLVVDDSLTVRELQRKLLASEGYQVEVATDGMEGWNAVRGGHFDLVITDIDMPRMDGIELVRQIRKDPHVKGLPVMIVSYKDRAEDRQRGLDAGADHYLAKGSFHDAGLLEAVRDLIGRAAAA